MARGEKLIGNIEEIIAKQENEKKAIEDERTKIAKEIEELSKEYDEENTRLFPEINEKVPVVLIDDEKEKPELMKQFLEYLSEQSKKENNGEGIEFQINYFKIAEDAFKYIKQEEEIPPIILCDTYLKPEDKMIGVEPSSIPFMKAVAEMSKQRGEHTTIFAYSGIGPVELSKLLGIQPVESKIEVIDIQLIPFINGVIKAIHSWYNHKNSNKDPLTKIYNKGTIEQIIKSSFTDYKQELIGNRLRTDKQGYGVVFMDINDLKKINTDYGHNIGDNVIRTLGALFNQINKEYEGKLLIGRVGGDEFLGRIRGEYSTSEVIQILKRINEQVRAIPIVKGEHLKMSFGFAYLNPSIMKKEHISERVVRRMKIEGLTEMGDWGIYRAKELKGQENFDGIYKENQFTRENIRLLLKEKDRFFIKR